MKHMLLLRSFRLAMLALWLVLASSTPVLAQAFSKDDERGSPAIIKIFRAVVAKPSESAVRILCNGKEACYGAVVDADGLIVTKASLLHGTITCKLKNGQEFPAEILGEHDGTDLAMVKIPAKNLVPVHWRSAKDLKQGMWLAAVGPSPDPLAIGVVGVLPRSFFPGAQAGPHPKAGYLGVALGDAPSGGALIKEMVANGPAAKAGLKAEDIVVQVGRRPVSGVKSLQSNVQRHKSGSEVILKVLRAKESLDIKVTLGNPPKELVGNDQDLAGSELSQRRGGFDSILQHDLVIKPVDCGGPLVDLDGMTVGINIARAGRTESYAIPAEDVQALLGDFKSGKLRVVELEVGTPVFKAIDTLKASGKLTDKDAFDKARPKSFHQVHTVKLLAGAEYTILLQSKSFDAFLRLEDAKGMQLEQDDDGGGDFNARIVFRAPADGDYRVIVTTFNEGETGDYTLTVQQTGAVKK